VTCSTLQVQFKNKGIISLMNLVSMYAPAAIRFLGWVGDVIFFSNSQVVVSRPGCGTKSTAEGKLTFFQVPWLGSIWKSWISAPRTVVLCGTHYLYHTTRPRYLGLYVTNRQTDRSEF